MKKYILTAVGLAAATAIAAVNAAPLMSNAKIYNTGVKASKNAITTGIVENTGMNTPLTSIYFYQLGDLPEGSTFPATITAKNNGRYQLGNMAPSSSWTDPIFYGANQEGVSGNNGCYFQFQIDQMMGDLKVAAAAQGFGTSCSASGTMLIVHVTGTN